MGGGLAFLTKKSFNPANWSNQRQVWEARQKALAEERRASERSAQLKREREEEEMARLVGEEEGGRKQLGFMYEGGRIPGLKRESEGREREKEGADSRGAGSESMFERRPGDDDAAAAFRAALARGTAEEAARAAPTSVEEAAERPADARPEATAAEHRDRRTNLEKAVGRGIGSGSGVTLAQQMERFPMLKGAPMVLQKPREGEAEADPAAAAGLNFKPLGQVIRNVRCLACGKWGHSRGERECEVSGWDPFRAASAAPAAEVALEASAPAVEKPIRAPIRRTEDDDVRSSEKRRHSRKKEKRRKDYDRREKRKRKHKRKRHRSPSSSGDSSDSSCDLEKRKRKHKRKRHRSPSSSSDSDDVSCNSRDRTRRGRDAKPSDVLDDASADERERRGSDGKESRHRSSSRRKRRRRRSRSLSSSVSDERDVGGRERRHRDDGRERRKDVDRH